MAGQTPDQTPAGSTAPAPPTAAGPAERALSSALATAFRTLRVVMVIVLVALLFSNTRFLRQNQRAVILRFGKIVGTGAGRVRGPGLVLAWPHPIDEIVVVDAGRIQVLEVDDFMYRPQWRRDPSRVLNNDEPLSPGQDGYTLTSDANILHTQWRIEYQIDDVILYALHVDDPERLIRTALAAAVVKTSAEMTINQVLAEALEEFRVRVRDRLQASLDEADSGIGVGDLRTPERREPLQTEWAFRRKLEADQRASTARQLALRFASDKLSDAAAVDGKQLAAVLDELARAEEVPEGERDEKKTAALEKRVRDLIETAGGEVAVIYGRAEAYKTRVTVDAEAMTAMLADLGPKWREHPRVFIQQLYQNAMQDVLSAAGIKFAVYPRQREIWIQLEPQYKKRQAEETQSPEPERSQEERQRMRSMGG